MTDERPNGSSGAGEGADAAGQADSKADSKADSGPDPRVPDTPARADEADITSRPVGAPGPGTAFGASEPLPPLRAALEAVLMVVDTPASAGVLAQVLERPREEVATALADLAAEYGEQGRGFELRQVAEGWRFYSAAACAPYVERFVHDGQSARLTQASLETLAVVAYRQPVSRARISAVRGVNVEGVLRTLIARGLVEEAGTEPESGAILYRTTSHFLERLGLGSLDDLPDLAPFLPDLEALEAENS